MVVWLYAVSARLRQCVPVEKGRRGGSKGDVNSNK
jgi:hypothetical protein